VLYFFNYPDKPKVADQDQSTIPLPDSAENSQDVPMSNSENNTSSNSAANQMSSLLASAMLGSMQNSSDPKQDDPMIGMGAGQGPSGIPGMPNPAFSIPRKYSSFEILHNKRI
jgi:hypothetical protein